MKNFKITVIKQVKNPYQENTTSWHQYIDILTTMDKNRETNLIKLCYNHDQAPKYYEDMSELVEDGLIKIEDI